MGDMNVWYFLFRTGEAVPPFESWVKTIRGEHPRMREMVERARKARDAPPNGYGEGVGRGAGRNEIQAEVRRIVKLRNELAVESTLCELFGCRRGDATADTSSPE